MAFLDHIRACNSHDLTRYRPFLAEGRRLGWVRHDTAALLAAFPETFIVEEDAVSLHPRLATPQARAAAVDETCAALAERHGYPALRGERYAVSARWGEEPLFTIDRAVVAVFGIRAYGVHVNGWLRRADGLHLWIGRRAPDKAVAPGKLDNIIAGGQPAGLSLMDNLVKEAAEEADIGEELARRAVPVGLVSYCFEDRFGLKPDTMFCYDLEVPEGVIPRNTDGEVESFHLMPAAEVMRLVRDTTEFKYNVPLVILDFLVRRGLLCPDSDPDYAEIVAGLRRG